MDYDKLREAAYKAFMQAFLGTKDSYKHLSWFARNRIAENKNNQEKDAA